jgi:hypothetical protein
MLTLEKRRTTTAEACRSRRHDGSILPRMNESENGKTRSKSDA